MEEKLIKLENGVKLTDKTLKKKKTVIGNRNRAF
jgi:hypothetical protein